MRMKEFLVVSFLRESRRGIGGSSTCEPPVFAAYVVKRSCGAKRFLIYRPYTLATKLERKAFHLVEEVDEVGASNELWSPRNTGKEASSMGYEGMDQPVRETQRDRIAWNDLHKESPWVS